MRVRSNTHIVNNSYRVEKDILDGNTTRLCFTISLIVSGIKSGLSYIGDAEHPRGLEMW